MNQKSDLFSGLRRFYTLEHGELPLASSVRTFMNNWAVITTVFLLFVTFAWFETGTFLFSPIFGIVLAIVIPILMYGVDITYFKADRLVVPVGTLRRRLILAFVLSCFTSLAFQVQISKGGIVEHEYRDLLAEATTRVNTKWDALIKTEEQRLDGVDKDTDKDKAAAEKRLSDQIAEATEAKRKAEEKLQRAVAINDPSQYDKVKSLKEQVKQRTAELEALRKTTITSKISETAEQKRSEIRAKAAELRAQKAEELKSLATGTTESQEGAVARIEKKYGLKQKDGLTDKLEIMYVKVPQEKGVVGWLILVFAFVLTLVLEMIPFIMVAFASEKVREYYHESKIRVQRAKREQLREKLVEMARTTVKAYQQWQVDAAKRIESQKPTTIQEVNEILRQLWVELVHGPATSMYAEADLYGDVGHEMIDRYLKGRGGDQRTDFHYESSPWHVDESEAYRLWNWVETNYRHSTKPTITAVK